MADRHKTRSHRQRGNLSKKLAGYSLAAGALLAPGSQAQAAIVSGSLDKGFLPQDFGTVFGPYALTMEGATVEASFIGTVVAGGSGFYVMGVGNSFSMLNTPSPNVGIAIGIMPLSASQSVGSLTNAPNNNMGLFYGHAVGSTTAGNGGWSADGNTAFFGFSFDLESNGTTVFGWGQVQRLDASNGRLIDWAYEESGRPIHIPSNTTPIPAPSSLALLALGLGTVAARRRKDKAS